MRHVVYDTGFALPTVLVASVSMLTVIVAAASAVSNVRVGLDSQYYNSLANDAAEAGVVYATACIKNNGGLSNWGPGGLTANTNCSGVAQDPNVQSPYVLGNNATYRTSFTVDQAQNTGAGVYVATVTGKVEFLRPNGAVWKTITKTTNMQTGGQISATSVVFGYVIDGGYFGVIGGDGKMRMAGFNGDGQLGTGSTNPAYAPTLFGTPANTRLLRTYMSFIEVGRNVVSIDSNGTGWIAGANFVGQAGTGQAPWQPIVTPQAVALPAGVKMISATINGNQNFFLGRDSGGVYNVYAAGDCSSGTLGTGTCPTPGQVGRVALPAYDSNNDNTIPTSQIVSDYKSAYVVMQGGALYGWGWDAHGQMWDTVNNNTFSDRYTPTRIGTYGDTGQPKVKQVVTDGDTAYILDSNGQVKSIGMAGFGQMGQGDSGAVSIQTTNSTSTCVDEQWWWKPESWGCTGDNSQKWRLRTANNSIQSVDDGLCLSTNTYSPTAGTMIVSQPCLANDNTQKFVYVPILGVNHGVIEYRPNNTSSGLCLDNESGSQGYNVQLWWCSGDYSNSNQTFRLYNADLTPMDTSMMPNSTVTKISADMNALMVMTADGKVWSMGDNHSGQFGIGTQATYVSRPTEFPMPSGVRAVDIYETSSTNLMADLLVIGSNGKIYGAGSNSYGQLGNGTTSTYQTTPVEMLTIDGTILAAGQVETGLGTTVIFTKTGSVYTVGNNTYGQLGVGDTMNRSVPIKSSVINDLTTRYY